MGAYWRYQAFLFLFNAYIYIWDFTRMSHSCTWFTALGGVLLRCTLYNNAVTVVVI
jgi:hypothetical protein